MDPDYKPEYIPHRSSTLFTKKHTKGRLTPYNLHVFKMQKNRKKYILPDKPKFWSGEYVYGADIVNQSPRKVTVDILK